MEELLCLTDSYLKRFTAKVVEAVQDGENARIVLDRTAFYPAGGGQPCDFGKIRANNIEYEVIDARKESGKVMHTIKLSTGTAGEGGLQGNAKFPFSAGIEVEGEIDWERRYKLMRMHTAGHVLASVMYSRGMQITGNQIGVEKTRFDFNMENFDRQTMEECISIANEKLAQGHQVKISFMPRDEALKLPGMVKLAKAIPPAIRRLRIVDIETIDVQADGGTHVANTSEVGEIFLVKAQNKGKNNRRIYYGLK